MAGPKRQETAKTPPPEPAREILGPEKSPAGEDAARDVDPRLDQVSEAETALERPAEPSDTVETEEADQRRKSDDIDNSGA